MELVFAEQRDRWDQQEQNFLREIQQLNERLSEAYNLLEQTQSEVENKLC